MIKNDELLEILIKFGKRSAIASKKNLTVNLYIIKKYLKPKIKSYKGKINANVQNNKILEEGSQCICLLVILIYLVYRRDQSYYPQVFLGECKYVVKEKKMSNYITDDINVSCGDSDKAKSDYSDEENSNE